ncbi:MAG: M1 family metallopeptidase [Bacteroidetes bacterium]|nr:M1 family metallopeptidase [Bacteroidota bacterium]
MGNILKPAFLLVLLLAASGVSFGYTRQDTLRGSNGPGRNWWDVLHYDLRVRFDTATQSVSGSNRISFRCPAGIGDSMQIDLQHDLRLSRVYWENTPVAFLRDGNVYWIKPPLPLRKQRLKQKVFHVLLQFEGKPRKAVNPPWDGGLIWTTDSLGKPWQAVACQGLGASSWWPCKDYQGDEPDSGMNIQIADVPEEVTVSNGRLEIFTDSSLRKDPATGHSEKVYTGEKHWVVRNPINTYDATYYIGEYVHWHDTLHAEKGILDLDFYPLREHEAQARKQWAQTKEMLHCFEYWLGPYPFYEDGYKLVEAPYLGMEHQSAIAYGNGFKNGYRRPNGQMIDRSGSGVGFAFDFIIIHESGHEWFGNSITARDVADNWLHEGFTTYTETLFAEWIKGKDSAMAYVQGEWKNIRNDRPVIGDYGVQQEGSSDMYDKGAAVVHMIRMMLRDDDKFRQMLRGLNQNFYHKIVTSREIEAYISHFTGRNLNAFFDVYLRSTIKPVLEWQAVQDSNTGDWKFSYAWKGTPNGFQAPFGLVKSPDKKPKIIRQGWYDVIEKASQN